MTYFWPSKCRSTPSAKTEITLSFPIFHLMSKIWYDTELLLFLHNNNIIHRKFKRLSSPIMQIILNSFLIIIWCQIIIKCWRKSLSLSNCWEDISKAEEKKATSILEPGRPWLQTWNFICSPERSLHSLQAETGASIIQDFCANLKKKKKKSSWKINVITLPALSKCNSPSLTQRRKKQGKKPHDINFAGCTKCLHIVTLLACKGIPVSTTCP